MQSNPITCMIPTHNRPQFLRRLFHYYQQSPPGYPFLVVDSSAPQGAAENQVIISQLPSSLNVSYAHFDRNIIDKCVGGLQLITTPLVAMCADDDLLFSDAVDRCIEFLLANPDYASAMGRTAELRPKLPAWCCRVLKGYDIEQSNPFDRCRQLASNWFTNFYGVYRTEIILKNFEVTAACTNSLINYNIPEMLLSQLSVLRGKFKLIPQMYSLMERHDSNAATAMRHKLWPQAEELFLKFKNSLTEQYTHFGIDRAEAERFIDDHYSYFRVSDAVVKKQPKPVSEKVSHFFHGLGEKFTDLISAQDQNFHRRFIRPSDTKNCRLQWNTAVQLMKEFPHGMTSDPTTQKRCA